MIVGAEIVGQQQHKLLEWRQQRMLTDVSSCGCRKEVGRIKRDDV